MNKRTWIAMLALLCAGTVHAHGRLVSVLEGGYSLSGLAAGVRSHVETLLQ